mgnify:FL=1
MNKYLPQNLPKLQELSAYLNKPLTFIDLETTGRVHEYNFAIIELGLVHIDKHLVVEKSSLVNPMVKIPKIISEITNIYDEMVKDKNTFNHFAPYIAKIAQNNILCGFNSKTFDSKGMKKMLSKYNYNHKFKNQLDIRHVFLRCRKIFDGIDGQFGSLVEACEHHNIKVPGQAHRAAYDIAITVMLAEKLIEKYGFGIFYKDIQKCLDEDIKKNYMEFLYNSKSRKIE